MSGEAIHLMFRRAAERYGDDVGVEWDGGQASYRELEQRSNDLAALLLERGIERSAPVAILSARTVDVVVAFLGTLKAGGLAVPLDLGFPAVRLESIVDQVRPIWWLVDSGLVEHVTDLGYQGTVLRLDKDRPQRLEYGIAPCVDRDPDDACYLYFSSGSTGVPKGIVGRLKAIDHFVRWEIETFGVGPASRVSQLTSAAFDAFLRDVFVPLAAGGTVCVPPGRETLLDARRLAEWIERRELNLLHCTPSLFRSLLGQDLTAERFAALRHVLLAGEPLLPSDVKRWHAVFGERIQLVNLYGPTETTMTKFFYMVRADDGEAPSIPIGKPMPGARAIVVDEKGRPCPPRKLGEIYIRTPFRSLGYFNQPELTREVFIQNPWSDHGEDIVYKTGDLGRIRDDGNFEFIGRRDHQVKVRGVRIELTPIEELLRSHPAITDAVVVARADTQGTKYLCAYIVLRELVEPAAVRAFLFEKLPEPVVPSAFVILEELPRTIGGKVDRKNLPAPDYGKRLVGDYVAPRTDVEEAVCGLFCELLGLPRVGVHDHFFELGGHSLLATLLISRVRSTFDVEVALSRVFRDPTVAGLALAITELQIEEEDAGEMAELVEEIAGLSTREAAELIEQGASSTGRE